jgi:hypothetical protein
MRSFAELKPIKLYICTVDALDPQLKHYFYMFVPNLLYQ